MTQRHFAIAIQLLKKPVFKYFKNKDVYFLFELLRLPMYVYYLSSFFSKHVYNRHINETKKAKTKIHKTIIRYNATVTPEVKLKEEQ